jgi:hypothetical protein
LHLFLFLFLVIVPFSVFFYIAKMKYSIPNTAIRAAENPNGTPIIHSASRRSPRNFKLYIPRRGFYPFNSNIGFRAAEKSPEVSIIDSASRTLSFQFRDGHIFWGTLQRKSWEAINFFESSNGV